APSLPATTTFSLTVTDIGSASTVSAGSPTVSITQGGAAVNEVITVTTTAGTAAPVVVSLSALPNGVMAVPTPASATCTPTAPCTVTFALSATSTATAGTVTITVTGTGPAPSLPATTTFSLTVTAVTFAFTVSAGSPTVSITQGGAAVNEVITVTRTAGTAAPVVVSLSALPNGVMAVPTPASATCTPTAPCTVTFALSATSTTTAATVTTPVTVAGPAPSLPATTTFSLTVTAVTFAFTVSAGSPTVSITLGGAAVTDFVTVTLSLHDALPIFVSLSALPNGVMAVPTPASATCTPTAPCTVTFALSATS